MFEKISIIGLGFMGGSLCKALRNKGYSGEIMVYDLDEKSVQDAIKEGVVDYSAKNIERCAEFSDFIVISTPLRYFGDIAMTLERSVNKETTVIDLGSVKKNVVEIFNEIENKYISFIGVHPMTGSDKSGYKTSVESLYEGAFCFLCPSDSTTDSSLSKVMEFFEYLDAIPVKYDSELHDETVALISHLPHIIAAALVNTLDYNEGIKKLAFIGGGFRDTTRIAAGNAKLWVDILSYNKEALLLAMDRFKEVLSHAEELIKYDDTEGLENYLASANIIRKSLPEKEKIRKMKELDLEVTLPNESGTLTRLMYILRKFNLEKMEMVHTVENFAAVKITFSNRKDLLEAMKVIENTDFIGKHTWEKGRTYAEKWLDNKSNKSID